MEAKEFSTYRKRSLRYIVGRYPVWQILRQTLAGSRRASYQSDHVGGSQQLWPSPLERLVLL